MARVKIIEVRSDGTGQGNIDLRNTNVKDVSTLTGHVYKISPPTPSQDEWKLLSGDLYTAEVLDLDYRKKSTGAIYVTYEFDPSAITPAVAANEYYGITINVNLTDDASVPQEVIDIIYRIVPAYTSTYRRITSTPGTYFSGATGLQGETGLTGLKGETGPAGLGTGLQGETGVAGVQGETGPAGFGTTGLQGETGVAGVQGETGPAGLGTTGLQGETGVAGTQGETGIQGATGANGLHTTLGDMPDSLGVITDHDVRLVTKVQNTEPSIPTPFKGMFWYDESDTTSSTGAQGVTGIQGETGVQGETGIAGLGTTGLQGETGLQGLTGVTGLQGETGIAGLGTTGLQGETGPAGLGTTGLQGETGLQGLTGVTGLQGDQGETGVAGETGLTGPTGLQGEQGETGVQGDQGETGVQGVQGNTGVQGETGVQGSTGLQGASGILGATGIQGTTGVTGASGIQGSTGISPWTREVAGYIHPTVTTDTLALGTTPTANYLIEAEKNHNGLSLMRITNTTDGTDAYAGVIARSSGNNVCRFTAYSASYATTEYQDKCVISSENNSGMIILQEGNYSIDVYQNAVRRVTLDANGFYSIYDPTHYVRLYPTATHSYIIAQSDGGNAYHQLYAYGGSSRMEVRSSNGTAAAPTYSTTGALFNFQGYGFSQDDTAFRVGCQLIYLANQNWTGNNSGCRIDWYWTKDGESSNSRYLMMENNYTKAINSNFYVSTNAADCDSVAVSTFAMRNDAVAPSSATDHVYLYAQDMTSGGAGLCIYSEQTLISESVTSNRTFKIKYNGEEIKVCGYV